MLLLKHVYGFEVAKEAFVIPRVARVMNLFVGPFIGKEDFSGIIPYVGECVKEVPGATSQPPMVHCRRRLRPT